MPDVRNWQLGRTMHYPFGERRPERQFAFVINTNRCIGCQTCTMACKSTWTFGKGQEHMWWTNVETKPYGGYPQGWDVKLLSMLGPQPWSDSGKGERSSPYGTYDGETIFEAARTRPAAPGQTVLGYLPTDAEWAAPNISEDTPVGGKGEPGKYHPTGESLPVHRTWFFYLARLCNHCSWPACLAACPRKAVYKRPEDGIVLIDQSECRGYRKCVEACPYKKSLYRPTTRVSEKCIACFPRVEGKDPEGGGVPQETRCMEACIGQVRMQGLVRTSPEGGWAEDPGNPLYYLVHVAKVALPLYPQFGTEPNGYYIPPRWVPRPYLRQMFGPGVDAALERYEHPDRELLAVLQLFRRDHRIIGSYERLDGRKVYEREIRGRTWAMYDDTVVARGLDGKELFRTRVEEPVIVRDGKHANTI
ncbi:MAG: nitrate oxidoreductase subunit beta [Planctomycetaceae bacterium]|nr:nitrate oxidoreductase subunit beta [Planctomycetota bacterium]NUN51704.1 nitrate oxidoreductase subunit beta [Planctomycetaceae bacterium]